MKLKITAEVEDEQIKAIVREVLETMAEGQSRPPAEAPEGLGRSTLLLDTAVEAPEEWRLVEEREDETYQWPREPLERYVRFLVYEGTTEAGRIRLALGECARTNTWGRDRKYYIVFHVTAGSKRPLVEFLEADDYEEARELIATIRGSDNGGRRMYDASDRLPAEYEEGTFRIETYSDRITYPGAWHKLAVVAQEGDVRSMLGHALIQAQTRFGIGPS